MTLRCQVRPCEGLAHKVNDVPLRVDAALGTKPEFDPASSHRQFSIVAFDCVASVLLDVLQVGDLISLARYKQLRR